MHASSMTLCYLRMCIMRVQVRSGGIKIMGEGGGGGSDESPSTGQTYVLNVDSCCYHDFWLIITMTTRHPLPLVGLLPV